MYHKLYIFWKVLMHRKRMYDSKGLKSKGENFCVTFVFCIDYIETMDNLYPISYSPLFF